jgi:hypothetical protein
LLGRGKRAINWGGNVRFRNLVKRWAGEYEKSTDPQNRDSIANRIMATIQEDGGRFLQLLAADSSQDDITTTATITSYTPGHPVTANTWVVISDTSARTKVKQALRDVSKVSRTRQKQRQTTTSTATSPPTSSSVMPAAAASAAASSVARRSDDDHSAVDFGDLEPRPIEEILRTSSSGTMLYRPPSLELLLLQQQQQQQQPQQNVPMVLIAEAAAAAAASSAARLPVDMNQQRTSTLLPHGSSGVRPREGEDRRSGIPYYPSPALSPSISSQRGAAFDNFQEILRRQQDILSRQLLTTTTAQPTGGQSHAAEAAARSMFQDRGGGPAAAATNAPVERLTLQLPPDRLKRPDEFALYRGGGGDGRPRGGSLHSTASSFDHMIGQPAAAAAAAHNPRPSPQQQQHQPSTVFLDQAIREQLNVDQRKPPPLPPSPPDDHSSTFGSFFEGHEEEGQELSSGDDDNRTDRLPQQQHKSEDDS